MAVAIKMLYEVNEVALMRNHVYVQNLNNIQEHIKCNKFIHYTFTRSQYGLQYLSALNF